jgi:hypothetical protein
MPVRSLYRLALCAFVALPLRPVLAQEPPTVSCQIRSIGIGTNHQEYFSPGFAGGGPLVLADRFLNGPVQYTGPAQLDLFSEGSGGGAQPQAPAARVALPRSDAVLLLGLSREGEPPRIFALPDASPRPGEVSVSILNLSTMPLHVKIGSDTARVAPGQVFHHPYAAPQERTSLPLAIIGEADGTLIPVTNNQLRLLPHRGVMLIVTGRDLTPRSEADLNNEDTTLTVIYPTPARRTPRAVQ